MLYVVGFFVVFVMGGLTGVMLAMVPFNQQAHDTYFVVAHLHYVLVGGFVFPMLAGAYYWLPHITGRETVHRISVPAFWLIFIGFNLTFFMMHLTGLMGMPRRVFTYPSNMGWDWLNLLSTIGGFILTMGFALFAVDVALQLRFGKQFRRNIWKAGTLEWAMPTPPPSYNFASLPHIEARADNLEVERIGPELASGSGYLGFVREGRMETLAVDVTTGELDHVMELPRQSYMPLISAALTGAAVLCMLFKLYWVALALAVVTFASFLFWSRTLWPESRHGSSRCRTGTIGPARCGERAPRVVVGDRRWIVCQRHVAGVARVRHSVSVADCARRARAGIPGAVTAGLCRRTCSGRLGRR